MESRLETHSLFRCVAPADTTHSHQHGRVCMSALQLSNATATTVNSKSTFPDFCKQDSSSWSFILKCCFEKFRVAALSLRVSSCRTTKVLLPPKRMLLNHELKIVSLSLS